MYGPNHVVPIEGHFGRSGVFNVHWPPTQAVKGIITPKVDLPLPLCPCAVVLPTLAVGREYILVLRTRID